MSARSWREILGTLTDGNDLSADEAAWAMNEIFSDAATSAQIAAFGVAALCDAGLLDEADHAALEAGYGFLLRVQNRLRIVHNRTLNAVPEAGDEVEKLARRLGCESGPRFLEQLEEARRQVRAVYRRAMGL